MCGDRITLSRYGDVCTMNRLFQDATVDATGSCMLSPGKQPLHQVELVFNPFVCCVQEGIMYILLLFVDQGAHHELLEEGVGVARMQA